MDRFPQFFRKVPMIVSYDPLADFLGTFDDGIIKTLYVQIVKSAGHSCPTVAGGFAMSYHALKALYGEDLPVRGEIKVEFRDDLEDGVIGVIANVISNITGATDKSGFKGIGGQFVRHSLMSFNAPINSMVRFTRVDTVKAVDVDYDHSKVSGDPRIKELMQKMLQKKATIEEKKLFGELWQDRVKKILIDNFDEVVSVKKV